MEGQLDWSYIAQEQLSETRYSRRDEEEDRSEV